MIIERVNIYREIISDDPVVLLRKLKIYNLVNKTNIKTYDLDINIINCVAPDSTILYKYVIVYNVVVNDMFDLKSLNIYEEKYLEKLKWLKSLNLTYMYNDNDYIIRIKMGSDFVFGLNLDNGVLCEEVFIKMFSKEFKISDDDDMKLQYIYGLAQTYLHYLGYVDCKIL